MSHLILGLDGGQTSTTAVICDLSGELLGLGRSGPANHVWEPGGVARAKQAVTQSVNRALRAAGFKQTVFEAAFLGLTGTKADGRTARAVKDCLSAKRLRVENDQVNALASVTAGKPGLVVIAGTGTITYGENARGRAASSSGWGWLLGDEGAGFWIARQAIAAACRMQDGRGEFTFLHELLLSKTKVDDLWDLHFLIYSERLDRAKIAALAEIVPSAAAVGDRIARRILSEAGRELGLSVGAVARHLNMQHGATTVGMVGGVFRGSKEVVTSFRRETRKHIPRALFAEPRFAPVIGSALLGLKLAGVRLTAEVLAKLEAASLAVGAK